MARRKPQQKRSEVETAVESYEAIRPLHEQFSARIAELLAVLLDQSRIRYQTIEHRAKSVSSFREKITGPGKDYAAPLEELPDLSGVRVIAYYADDVGRIRSVIESEFEILSPVSGDKLDEMAPHEFGYRSVHCVAKLSDSRKGLVEWRSMRDLRVEIQIRTVLQHAWAAISHALQYKHEAEIPKALRRRLFRLAGLLELADEEFATVRDEHQALASDIKHSRGAEVSEFTIDRLTLKKYLTDAAVRETVMASAKEAGFGTMKEMEDDQLAYLAWTCSRAEIRSIAQLDSLLTSVSSGKATTFFKSVRQDDQWTGSLPFFVMMLVIGLHRERFSVDSMEDNGWAADRAKQVLGAADDL